MKKLIYLTFIGLLGLLFSCKEDGDQVYILDNPVAPTIRITSYNVCYTKLLRIAAAVHC